MNIAAVNGGSGPLGLVTVKPYARENQHARQTFVRLFLASGPSRRVWIGPLPRERHLITFPSGLGTVLLRVAVKDEYGVWSEAREKTYSAPGSYSAGSGLGSIGSGAMDDVGAGAPLIAFPDLSTGSGTMRVWRTLVGSGFADEARAQLADGGRSAITAVLDLLDDAQVEILHRWFEALNGAQRPFTFDWRDPVRGTSERLIVRFREPSLASELFDTTLHSMSFTLIELASEGKGGDI